jgi:GNAT superfamily N-acetyltransferase
MGLSWVRDSRPVWDADKQRVIGGAPPGALDLHHEPGAGVPGDWWCAQDDDGTVVGYAWLDSTWGGDAEVLLAVDPSAQNRGVGTFLLSHIEQEAARQGVNYVYNKVRATHPDHDGLHDWLAVRGYEGGNTADVLRKHVRVEPETASARPTAAVASSAPLSARPPGHEESGGYVDVDDHRY